MEEEHECVLCKYAGGNNADINDVMKYIHDNISKLSIDEIARQVHQVLPSYPMDDFAKSKIAATNKELVEERSFVAEMIKG